MIIFTPYAIPSIISTVVIFYLLIYIIVYRRNNAGAWQVIPLMIGFFIWAFGYSMVLLNTELEQKVFWFNLSQFGPDFGPVIWFFLALEHTGRRSLFQKKWIYAVFILPVFTTLLMWTNDWHHLLRRSVALSPLGYNTTYLTIERGPWFYWESFYGYIFIFLSSYLLIRFIGISSSKKQTLTMTTAILIPVVFNLLDIFKLNPLKPYGATSVVFSITGIILAWGLFREHFLDIAPIARNIVLEKIGDGVVVVDRHHRIVDVNPAAYPLFRSEYRLLSQVVGKKIGEMISLWSGASGPFEIGDSDRRQMELIVNGERRFYNVTSSLIARHRNESIGWVIIFNDITEVKQTNERLQNQLDEINRLQMQLREQVIHDSLTGCYNRHYLSEMLTREISRATREKHTIGLMMLDIDYFKKVNDTYGHASGDLVLQTIAEKLRRWVRMEDSVFRYGGEEFLVILPGISSEAIMARAKCLCRQISELPLVLSADVTIHVTVSLGVALYPLHGDNIQEVLKCADLALYDAKHAGRNTVIIRDVSAGGTAVQ